MTTLAPPVTLGFTNALLSTLQTSRHTFDEFILSKKKEIETLTNSGFVDLSQKQQQLEELLVKLEQVKDEAGRKGVVNMRNKEEEGKKREEVKLLEEQVKIAGPDLEALKATETEALAALSTLIKTQNQTSSTLTTTLASLNTALTTYATSLSLTFSRSAGQKLRLTFTNINPSNPLEEFSFTLNVDKDDLYGVEECSPPISGMKGLVDVVNKSNDFGAFVRGVRNGFVALFAVPS